MITFRVKCPDCGRPKSTYATKKTECPYCGKQINVRKCRVNE